MTCGDKNLPCLFLLEESNEICAGGFCRAWVQMRDAVQQCCPVWWPYCPFLMVAQSFSSHLSQKAIAGADEQQATAMLHCARCCGIFEGALQDVAWSL